MATSPLPEVLVDRDAYLAALHRLEDLWPEEPGTPQAHEANKIKALLDQYERAHWNELREPMSPPLLSPEGKYDHWLIPV